ncbi:MAG: 30S ribosomal protein S16 [Candidatus Campbellbacteria bacterium]|nr:30S ribosomal protein S16 [Candidatus Campbellbacteria bacterium]
MLKIRLQRVGRKNDPSFRVVVLESTQGPKAGKHVDQIGFYNAVTKQKTLDSEKAKYWMSKGAQPSDTVYNMLVTAGAVEGKKRNALPKKSPIKKDEPEVTVAPAPVQAEAIVEASVAEEVPVAPVEEVPTPVAEEVPVVSVEETPATLAEEVPVLAPEETPTA